MDKKTFCFCSAGRSVATAVLVAIVAQVGPMAAAVAADSAWNRPDDLKAVLDIENRLTDPAAASKLSSIVAKDAVMLDVFAPGIHKGAKQVLAAHAAKSAEMKGGSSRFIEMNSISSGSFACSASEVHYDYKTADGTPAVTEVRQLDAFKKIDGRWQLVQQHISAPVGTTTTAMVKDPLPDRGALTWDTAPSDPEAVSPAVAHKAIVDWTVNALKVIGIDAGLGFFAPGQNVVLYGEFYPGNVRGADEIKKYYGPIMGSYKSIDVKNPVFAVDTDGLLGAQIDTQSLLLHMNDGSTKDIAIRQSDCLRHIGGKWRSALEMVSFPIDRSTGKAIMRASGEKLAR